MSGKVGNEKWLRKISDEKATRGNGLHSIWIKWQSFNDLIGWTEQRKEVKHLIWTELEPLSIFVEQTVKIEYPIWSSFHRFNCEKKSQSRKLKNVKKIKWIRVCKTIQLFYFCSIVHSKWAIFTDLTKKRHQIIWINLVSQFRFISVRKIAINFFFLLRSKIDRFSIRL